jgi:hypothetical protein
MLSNKLCPRNALLVAVHHGELIPTLVGTLEEDYYADTRAASCHAMRHLLLTGGDKQGPATSYFHAQIVPMYARRIFMLSVSSVPMCGCTGVLVYQCTSVLVYQWLSGAVYLCTSVPVYLCTSAPLYHCPGYQCIEWHPLTW